MVVVHTDDPGLKSGATFAQVGLQIAGGVPLMCGEPEDWSTFRLGLFGLDKLGDVDGTVARLADGLDRALALKTEAPAGITGHAHRRHLARPEANEGAPSVSATSDAW